MIRSRVLTPGFRLVAGLALYAFVASFVFALGGNINSTDQGVIDSVLGPITVGWKGGVGSHVGYVVLLGTAIVAGTLAGLLIAFRDTDPEAQAQIIELEHVPLTRAPYGASFAPIAAALAGVGVLIGLVASTEVLVASLFVLVGVGFVWTTRAWANRATGDDDTNLALYDRIMDPLRVPIVGAIAIAFVVLGLSRVLLAVSKMGSVVVFSVVATVFFIGAALIAAKPRLSRNLVSIVLVFGALAILGGAIAGLIAGERDFEHHGPGHGSAETEAEASP